MFRKFTVFLLFTFFISTYSYSQKVETSAEKLAIELANPVADLISVPFQNNTVWGIGEYNGSQNVLNFQPVIPIAISKNINIINRIIVPMVTQYNITGPGQNQNSLGDIVYSIFISPNSKKLIWGIGPVMSIPTATNKLTGSGRFSVGPTGVILKQSNGWTFGALINQYWSVGGNPDRGNQTVGYLQPFLNYNWKGGGGISMNAEMTQNWKIKRTQTFMNILITGITKLGKFPVSLGVGPRIPITASPEAKGFFGIRAVATFIFPK
ncbi:MAG TPA: hypothetical protein PK294_02350 [Ignavibacteria bacterium]|nr:hypothetical protein [Ignavibacteria bacterium]HQY51415.1 hypothetical protein [Ignavibacteria bacterium]HRA99255.1 hypothetical protein [Ignavibacteria bacterium]